tara:strand:- start:355 stop:492 length:138 start_codon:yes stop_codon:yes gene_type:complete
MAIRIELPNGTMLEVNTEDEEVARATADDYIQKNPKFNEPNYDAV